MTTLTFLPGWVSYIANLLSTHCIHVLNITLFCWRELIIIFFFDYLFIWNLLHGSKFEGLLDIWHSSIVIVKGIVHLHGGVHGTLVLGLRSLGCLLRCLSRSREEALTSLIWIAFFSLHHTYFISWIEFRSDLAWVTTWWGLINAWHYFCFVFNWFELCQL